MNNIKKPNIFIYIGLLIILFILIVIASIISLSKKQTKIVSPTPTTSQKPTTDNLKPTTYHLQPILITPTGTGGIEDIPKNIADSATQKQNLKKKLPIETDSFKIEFDYATDKFTVTLYDSKIETRKVFTDWLKKYFPLISLSKFEIK